MIIRDVKAIFSCHRQVEPSSSDASGGGFEAPLSFDPYRFRGVLHYYEKSGLDSEDDWTPIDSPWKSGSQQVRSVDEDLLLHHQQ